MQLLDRVGGRQRAMLMVTGLIVAAGLFGISRWATAPEWVPAFTNQPIETVGQMTDKLQQAGILYKLDHGGTDILVSAGDVARARVTLAKDGLPSAGRPGLELFDQPSWGMTDFTQRINYRRALEGELERTIGKMRGVQAAQVHLALHEQSTFRQADKPSNASVVLRTGGAAPAQDVVQGIAHLVASSVDGLSSDHVTVLDDSGRLLSTPMDDGSMASLTNSQLATQREVESYLQNKAEGMVGDIVGPGNARVRVTASLNFDKIERQSELVDPEKQATSTEQKYEITPGAQGGAASSNVATSYDNSKVTESFSGAIGNVKRLSVAVLVNDRLVPAPANSRNAKPSYAARTPAEIARIESLVRSAVGADSARGDMVTVVATHLDGADVTSTQDPEKPGLVERVREFQKPAVSVLAIVAMMVIAMMLVRAIKSMPAAGHLPERGQLALGAPQQHGATLGDHRTATSAALHAHSGQMDASATSLPPAQPLRFPDDSGTRGRVVATIAAKPEVSARVVRAWLKEA